MVEKNRGGEGIEVAEVSKIYHVSRMSGVPCHKGDLGHVPLQDPVPSVRTLLAELRPLSLGPRLSVTRCPTCL